jgi:hypothetical protein
MKTRFSRSLVFGLIGLATVMNSVAATRICSVYLESYAVLQKQLFLGAELFQAPQLGSVPMMISMGLPGAAQMNNDKPIAVHVLDIGSGSPGFILEVTPVGTAEAYLQALAGAKAALPAPANGLYLLADGTAARIVGTRLLLAPKAKDPAACLGGDMSALPAMPAVPGAIRVSVAPAALSPMLDTLRQMMAAMPATVPNADQSKRMVESMIDFYAMLLGQVDAMHMGISMQPAGLLIRSRLVPKAGTDIAAMVNSVKPASADQLAFIEKDSLFSYASGSATFPPALKQQFIDLYLKMAALAPGAEGLKTGDLTAAMNQSMEAVGVPLAFTGMPPAKGQPLQMQGMMCVSDPAAYLSGQLAMLKMPAIQKLSSMTFEEPVKRAYQGLTVLTCKYLLDENTLAKSMRAALPSNTPPAQAEAALQASTNAMHTVMQLFGNSYEYAATPKAVVFGMGAPAMIEQAIGRVQAPAASSPEALRIRNLLAAEAAPHALGRLSLIGLVDMILSAVPGLNPAPQPDAAAQPVGEGIIFADWTANGEIHSALLMPPSEIKAVKAQMTDLTARGRGGN